MAQLRMELGEDSYNITVECGALKKANELFDINRQTLILTDDGVPDKYANLIASQAKQAHIITLEQGEKNKCPEKYLEILKKMLELSFDRRSCVVAVGGGVIGDLAGFVAASYMRGVDFYNVPTTLLAQIDSSIGGKVAIDFCGYKNILGAFYQPKGVLIDPNVLDTLDARQYGCGMAEIIKMYATSNKKMFERLEDRCSNLTREEMIVEALKIKADVVMKDEKENGLRKILNFGHTVGHAVESISSKEVFPLLHGECVGIGMLAVSESQVRRRIMHLLHRYDLPTAYRCSKQELIEAMLHDKKNIEGKITTVHVPEIGEFLLKEETAEEIAENCGEVVEFI